MVKIFNYMYSFHFLFHPSPAQKQVNLLKMTVTYPGEISDRIDSF